MSVENYELTLTPNYVSDWTFADAIRELIQNGIDAETIDPSNKFSIEYDEEDNALLFRNTKSKLKINTLLLGRSSKSKNEDTIGKFGEGYKIAALVLNRLNKEFTIYNKSCSEVWTSRFKNSAKWKEQMLTFSVEKLNKISEEGLCIRVGNVEWNEYNELYNIWLGINNEYEHFSTEYGDVITDEQYEGEIYVNGLKINCNSNLKYGYDIKPKYITLERDRKTCDSWDVEHLTSKMISQGVIDGKLKIETISSMIESDDVRDINHLEYHMSDNNNVKEIKKSLLEEFDKQYSSDNNVAIPVSSQNYVEMIQTYGGTPITVPSVLSGLFKEEAKDRIDKLKKSFDGKISIRNRLTIWRKSNCSYMSTDALTEFNKILDDIDILEGNKQINREEDNYESI